MKKEQFYLRYANLPLNERFKLLSNAANSPVEGMTLDDVYKEIKAIDNKLRNDEIRREELLKEVEKYIQ
jgi:hypothetical protein